MPPATATTELLPPREVPLGGQRAMRVRRTLPHRNVRTVGSWCFVDDYGPSDLRGTPGMQVPPHPHTGLQTVSWLLDGEVLHRDSLGHEQLVLPGQLNLMTAGRGIAHSEATPRLRGSEVLRGVQLWVALPDGHRHVDPSFEHHARLPVVDGDGWSATVIIGSLAGAADDTSPARAYAPIVGAEVRVTPGRHALPLDPGFEHLALALDPGLVVSGVPVPAGSALHLLEGADHASLATGSERTTSRLLLLGGPPLEEDLLMWWNFVARSHDEVVEMRATWQRQVAGEDTRFGAVDGHPAPPLPAPALPTVRLRPRPGRR